MIEISTDKSRLEIDVIHKFLTTAYWAKGRTIEEVKKSISHCLCFGVYLDKRQIGFARIATDYTVFAYLMDVFILPEFRGKGYSKKLMKSINEEPKLQTCKVWMLKTSDAHNLYKQFGYNELSHPDKVMERILK
ncbi:Acetyltransferase (GNAT) domain-containing protein [Flaviramulus basaltis]|uniref:Acetyltransferase (GNAT) domain-containing protein n=1 Tax=Flaviramulus basaltis TaxID=369401 RepID=A0A1K2IAT5_9FLAO|nr:GNAT family N-acetyltransferase [Flaviramulus basaltis]SFZ89416.1 Acetyltransferase (GNAT) domain-containing protein [Flaviramulus basaltis]